MVIFHSYVGLPEGSWLLLYIDHGSYIYIYIYLRYPGNYNTWMMFVCLFFSRYIISHGLVVGYQVTSNLVFFLNDLGQVYGYNCHYKIWISGDIKPT